MRIFIAALMLSLFSITSFGQELHCMISVSSQQDYGSDRTIYNSMQTSLFELMNNKRWTGLNFKVEERIECSIMITITDKRSDVFDAQIMVQSTRPVFNSSYKTPVFSFLDKNLKFEYIQDQSLDFVEGSHLSNLTSVLAFYAYIVIAIDFETMQKGAGAPYFDKAQAILNNAQSDPKATGWKAFESDKNRYWLLENLTNSRYSQVKEGLYSYHRLGLDVMYDNQEAGRQAVVDAIMQFQRAYNERPNLFILTLILNTKADEIVKIFLNASAMQKSRVVQTLTNIDPANTAKYNRITQGQQGGK